MDPGRLLAPFTWRAGKGGGELLILGIEGLSKIAWILGLGRKPNSNRLWPRGLPDFLLAFLFILYSYTFAIVYQVQRYPHWWSSPSGEFLWRLVPSLPCPMDSDQHDLAALEEGSSSGLDIAMDAPQEFDSSGLEVDSHGADGSDEQCSLVPDGGRGSEVSPPNPWESFTSPAV